MESKNIQNTATIDQGTGRKTFFYYEVELDAKQVERLADGSVIVYHFGKDKTIPDYKFGWYLDECETYEEIVKQLKGTKGIQRIRGTFKYE